jgi:FkbM family methyltransferase
MTYGERASSGWTTPKGHFARITYRLETSDWNTVSSVMRPHDEYALATLDLRGQAADIGAHIGSVTLALLLDNPELRVTAIEPVPDNVELLRLNLETNGVADRCTVIEAAVGSGRKTTIRYGYTGSENATHHAFIGNTAIVYPVDGNELPHVERSVPVLRLVDLGPLDFIKIDCEGGEWGFLKGTALAKVARIHGEAHPVLGHRAPDMATLLAQTHDVTFSGANLDPGPCGFVAVAR